MKRITLVLFTAFFVIFGVSTASATTVTLYNYLFNVNGTSTQTPGGLDGSGFNWSTGLGELIWTSPVASVAQEDFYFIAFFDHEIDETTNTYFNEFGVVNGSPAGNQSWEIDEPGFRDHPLPGDIFTNVQANTLDNTNPAIWPDDVSMALGWLFDLGELETATITLILSDSIIPPGFFLQQTDPGSNASIYFSSTLEISAVPIPSALLLFGSGLFGLAGIRKKLAKK